MASVLKDGTDLCVVSPELQQVPSVQGMPGRGEMFILAGRGKDSRLGAIGTERHNGALCCCLN